MEVDNPLARDLTTILWSRCRNVGNAMRDHVLIEAVVVVMIVEAVVEAVVDLFQALAELTLGPYLGL
jgi:hypothetical protein